MKKEKIETYEERLYLEVLFIVLSFHVDNLLDHINVNASN